MDVRALGYLTCCLFYALALTLAVALNSFAYGATIVINNTDPAGFGFNDPEPRAPVDGNNGATLGEQRLNAINRAASRWGGLIQSNVVIRVNASFATLFCDAVSATLGGATPTQAFANFPGAPRANTLYVSALADALSGSDIAPGADFLVQFNAQIEGNPACLGGRRWYYGFNHDSGSDIDFLNVLMHEFAHGLGFASLTNEATGQLLDGKPSIYDVFVRDLTQNLTWAQMSTDEQRRQSAINTGNLVWEGSNVNAQTAFLTGGIGANGMVRLYAPNPIVPGSSISHWDTSVAPDALMEPFITPNLRAGERVDLTTCLLADIGWSLNLSGSCLHISDIMVSPQTLDFGFKLLGTPVTDKVVVTNNGSADLEIGAIAIIDALAPPFSIVSDNCSNVTLIGGNTCDIEVRFAPNSTGTFSDSFDIPSNDFDTPIAVSVIGKVEPQITVVPSTHNFGFVGIGGQLRVTIEIDNQGTLDLNIGNVATLDLLSVPFSIANDECSSKTIGSGNTCDIEVIFEPSSVGMFSDSFDIPSNDPDTPIFTVNLKGEGRSQQSQINVSPSSVIFGAVEIDDQKSFDITVTNQGIMDLVIGKVADSDSLVAPFAISADNCSNRTLLSGNSCLITVTFSPASQGTFSDTFSIPSDDANNPNIVVSLTGSGQVIVVATQSDGGGGGGCSLNKNAKFDPTFLLLVLISVLYLLRRRYQKAF